KIHAVLLAGGSAFGLDAASGVMRYLEENRVGFQTRDAHIPIVPAAILYDLSVGRGDVRPDAKMGYQACVNASGDEVAEGNIGAGTGASVGKVSGMQQAMKSGVGGASIHLGHGVVVGALVVVNALGDIHDLDTGECIAGVRGEKKTLELMRMTAFRIFPSNNTVLGVVAV